MFTAGVVVLAQRFDITDNWWLWSCEVLDVKEMIRSVFAHNPLSIVTVRTTPVKKHNNYAGTRLSICDRPIKKMARCVH